MNPLKNEKAVAAVASSAHWPWMAPEDMYAVFDDDKHLSLSRRTLKPLTVSGVTRYAADTFTCQ